MARTECPRWLLLISFLFLLSSPALADPPQVVRYQARLVDDAGVPLTGTRDLTFQVFAQESGGAALWTEVQMNVALGTGSVDVLLGETVPLGSSIFSGPDRWLQVTVGASPLLPRQRLSSVPFSLATDRLGTMTLSEIQIDIDARIGAHGSSPSAHHVKTTDAAELTGGSLDPARIAPDSLTAAHILDGPGSGLNADQVDGFEAAALMGSSGPKTLTIDSGVLAHPENATVTLGPFDLEGYDVVSIYLEHVAGAGNLQVQNWGFYPLPGGTPSLLTSGIVDCSSGACLEPNVGCCPNVSPGTARTYHSRIYSRYLTFEIRTPAVPNDLYQFRLVVYARRLG